jgi:hypothetical protein
LAYNDVVHAVVETPQFISDAKAAGLSDTERAVIINSIAASPAGGAVIQGTGGARKNRFAGRGKGKSGGYRVITFYAGPHVPVFLLALYSKGERADLSKAERNELRSILGQLVETYGKGVIRRG